MIKRKYKAAAVLAIATLVLTGCSEKQQEPFQDAGTDQTRNSGPAQIIEMPDGFNNAATKCDHGNRLYISYHGDGAYVAIAVVPQDPTCAGG